MTMKKLTSMVLSLIILLSAITCCLTDKAYAAEAPMVTVKSTSQDPLSGYYAVYEYKGREYRSDEMGASFNRRMWDFLSDTDRKKITAALAYREDRVAQFGKIGNEKIMEWHKNTDEWVQANEQWRDRIMNRDFPELRAFYAESSLRASYPDLFGLPMDQMYVDKGLKEQYYIKMQQLNELWNMGTAAGWRPDCPIGSSY